MRNIKAHPPLFPLLLPGRVTSFLYPRPPLAKKDVGNTKRCIQEENKKSKYTRKGKDMRYIRAVGYWICGAASHCGRRRISQEKEKEKTEPGWWQPAVICNSQSESAPVPRSIPGRRVGAVHPTKHHVFMRLHAFNMHAPSSKETSSV